MREYTSGFAGKDTAWEAPKKRYVGVSDTWTPAIGRWVGDAGAWVRYWPPQLRSNGYCRQTYTSTWNGSSWGAAVSSGPASCGATFGPGANTWVASGTTATATFYNALGIGDFDCVQSGVACATVASVPNNLPNPESDTWAIAPAYISTGLLSLWSQSRSTGTWAARGSRTSGELPFYHKGARRWFIVSSAGLWRGPNDIGAIISTSQTGWTQLSSAQHNWQESTGTPQTSRRFVNLSNGKLLLSRGDGYIVTIDASGAVESALQPPTLSGVVHSSFFEANGVTFYSTGNYQNGFPAPTLCFSANPAGGSWTTVNMAQFPGWYYLIGITWNAADSTFRLIVSVAAGALGGVYMQYVYSSPDGATWTEIVGARNGLSYAASITLVIGTSIVKSSDNGSNTRFAVSTNGGSTWTDTLLLTYPDIPTVLLPDPLTFGDFWAPGLVTGGYGMVRYRLSGTTITKVGEVLLHASINVTPDSAISQSW